MDDAAYILKHFGGHETEVIEIRARLAGSLLLFTQTFFYLLNNRPFKLSHPVSNESHFISICRDLTCVLRGTILYELINMPPGWGKSVLCKSFVAWAQAQFPSSRHMYVSYSSDLASEHTYEIKRLIQLPFYRKIFGVELSPDSTARDLFKTTAGGVICAFGAKGSITGMDAGLPSSDEYSGALIMDDMHKPDEVWSDTTREAVIKNYFQTIKSRKRGLKVPVVFVGQRLHEDDLPEHFIKGRDGNKWHCNIIKALDDAGNARYPEVHPRDFLEKEREINEEVYWAQYQQNPLPIGGSIFKNQYWAILDKEPTFLMTFNTIDTAETDKNYNDATVFAYWGIYALPLPGGESTIMGLHCIDLVEIFVEPKDLESEFLDFYASCRRHNPDHSVVAIERKSTGVTLSSVLSTFQGMRILNVERTAASGSKTARYLSIQSIIAAKRVSLPRLGRHTQQFIQHMVKITKNNSHRRDDIADNVYDAVKIALIDKTLSVFTPTAGPSSMVKSITSQMNRLNNLRNSHGAHSTNPQR